jgi:pyruvate dehydrogenase E2 component (dihydrolipoamide acetyltransferase)
VFKKYFHIGVAVDTPGGLLVPVIRDADRKSLAEIAAEIAAVSQLARTKGLPLERMSGGCFSISSLGSIGGTAFTPIINAPEVAILGVSKAQQKPLNVDGQLQWRSMLPLSLSYDHRVINGADAARFCVHLAQALGEPERLADR